MKARSNRVTIRPAVACSSLSAVVMVFSGAALSAEDEAAKEPDPEANSIDLVVGAVSTDGNDAAFQRRLQRDGDFYGGIESMKWGQDIGDDMSVLVEGHAIFGSEDYGLSATLNKDDVGYIAAGVSQFRTFYDGSGGYMPGAPTTWYPLFDDERHVDRGSLWFEAGLRKEDFPEITFRYEHDWRDGQKDSTIWGRNELGKGILPTLHDIDEQRDTFSLDITHTLGNTDLGLGIRYETGSNDDTRVMRQGGPNAVATPPATDNRTADRTVTDASTYDYDLFNAHVFSETRFNEKLLLSFGYSYTSMDTDIGGNRPSVDAAGALRTASDHALFGLTGGAQSSLNVVNANLWWNPVEDLVIVPSFRAEYLDQSGWGWHITGVNPREGGRDATPDELNDALNGIGWPSTLALEEVRDSSDLDQNEFTESLEIRYNGLPNLVLYAGAEFTQMEGDMWRSTIVDSHLPGTDTEEENRWTDSNVDRQKYTLGANWYPMRRLSFGAKYYHRESQVDYDNTFDPDLYGPDGNGDGRPDPINPNDSAIDAMDSTTDDVSVRMTWRALPCLTFVTRYDYSQTSIENRGYMPAIPNGSLLAMTESGDITQHIFSQSATWMPLSQMYVQGSVSYVVSDTNTSADYYGPGLVTDFENDYLVASLTMGYAFDQKTDIQATYSYLYSDNYAAPYYLPATSSTPGTAPTPVTSVGYGSDLQEHMFSLALNRRITPNMVWTLGYGFFSSEDDASGGFNDFDSHIVTTGLHIRF